MRKRTDRRLYEGSRRGAQAKAAQTAVLNEKELDVEKSGSSSDFIRQTKTVSPEKSHGMRASWKRSQKEPDRRRGRRCRERRKHQKAAGETIESLQNDAVGYAG